MHAQAQQFIDSFAFNYFDLAVLIWLVIGIFRGRKLGMSQELLPMLKWILVMVLGGLFYAAVASSVRQNTGSFFGRLGANLLGYFLIMIALLLIFSWIKKLIGEKLIGSDAFGGYEYYLGMLGGLIRYACIVVVLLALMDSRVYTKAENDAFLAAQKKQLDNSFFPSYGEIQYECLTTSFTGRTVRNYLSMFLIKSVTPSDTAPGETPAQKKNDVLNDVLGPSNK